MKILEDNLQRLYARYPTMRERRFFSPALWNHYRVVAPLLRDRVQGEVLDVGAGNSPYRSALPSQVRSYHTLDLSPRGIELTYTDDAQSMQSVPDNRYDVVLNFEVLEHVPFPDRVLVAIHRVLKPNGSAIISVPHLSRLHEIPHDYHRFTEFEIRRLVQAAGLRLELLVPSGGLFSFIAHQISTIVVLGTWHVPIIGRLFFWVNYCAVVVPALIVDQLLHTSRRFPEGYVFIVRK